MSSDMSDLKKKLHSKIHVLVRFTREIEVVCIFCAFSKKPDIKLETLPFRV